jgi:hypothetical protein
MARLGEDQDHDQGQDKGQDQGQEQDQEKDQDQDQDQVKRGRDVKVSNPQSSWFPWKQWIVSIISLLFGILSLIAVLHFASK